MDELLRLINQPGWIRWFVDIVILPALVVVAVFGLRFLVLRLGRRWAADEEARQVQRRTSEMIAIIAALAGIAAVWNARLEELAARPDTPFAGREEIAAWLGGTANAIVATAVLLLLVIATNRIFKYVVRRLNRIQQAREGVRMQGATLITPYQVRQFAISVLKVLRFVVIAALLYAYVPLVLRLIPATRPLADRVIPLVLGPVQTLGEAAVGYLPRFLSLVIIIIIVRWFLKLLTLFMGLVGRGRIRMPGFDAEWADQTLRLAKILVVLGTLMIIYPFLPGSGSEVFRGFSLFVGAVFTLGASSSVNNLISGIILTYTRSFHTGDRVNIGQATGDVIGRGLFVTRIRTIYGEEITVPNNVALSGRVTNFSAAGRGDGLALRVRAGIGYDVDWRRVHELMKAAAAATEHVKESPEPFVLQNELGDFAVNYELVAWTGEPKLALRTESELRQNVLDQFHAAGVEIMTPDVTAVRNALEASIPEGEGRDAPAASPWRTLGLPGTS